MTMNRRLVRVMLGCLMGIACVGTATAQQGAGVSANAALRYWMAFALLRETATPAAPGTLDQVANGRGAWDEASIGPLVTANADAVEMLRRGAALPACDWGLDWDMGPRMPVAHLPKARVLGRLGALAALRASARGQTTEAVETWMAGVRFATHVASNGSLISTLTARAILGANLRTMTQAAGTRAFDHRHAERIAGAIGTLPIAAFAWDEALAREAEGVAMMVRMLRASANPEAAYRDMTGASPQTPLVVPTDMQMREYRHLMQEIAAALRLPPDASRQRLNAIAPAVGALPALLRQSIPALGRLDDTRAELESEKQALLAALGKSRG